MGSFTVRQAVALKWLVETAFQTGQEYPNSKPEDHFVWNEREEIFYMIADGRDQEKFAEAADEFDLGRLACEEMG